MMGPKQEAQGVLFHEFSIDDHVLQDHLLRWIDRFVDQQALITDTLRLRRNPAITSTG
jgi:hypothetical protein